MNEKLTEGALPLPELEKIGLYKDGKLSLSKEDITALLAGRRTNMLSLKNLASAGFAIKQLDAKLSVNSYPDGSTSLNIHPIYKEVKEHPLLSKSESQQLQSGKLDNIQKQFQDADHKSKKLIIEYDEQTREFVSYDPEQVQIPEKVNGQRLTDKQKEAFQNGEVIELNDGTRLQHRASDSKGIVSDRKWLVLSVLLDGGISYLLLRGVKNLMNNNEAQQDGLTEGFKNEVSKMKAARNQEMENEVLDSPLHSALSQQSRGYGHTASR